MLKRKKPTFVRMGRNLLRLDATLAGLTALAAFSASVIFAAPLLARELPPAKPAAHTVTAIPDTAIPEALTWQEAARLTLEKNPVLQASGYELAAQAGRTEQAGLKPNPELALTVEDAGGSGDYSSLKSAEYTLSISWMLEGEQRRARVNHAEAANMALLAQRELKRMDALADTARWYAQAMALQAQADLANSSITTAEKSVTLLEQRVIAGKSPSVELARSKVELAKLRLQQTAVTHEQASAHRRLAAQWGETRVSFTMVDTGFTKLPTLVPFTELQQRVKAHPRLTYFLTQERVHESQIALAQAQAKPQWRASAGIKQLAASNDHALVAGVSVPLAVFDRQQGHLAEARALAALNRSEREAQEVALDAALFALHQELLNSLNTISTYKTIIIPALDAAVAEASRAYEVGRYSYQERANVQRELQDARRDYLSTVLAAHLQSIEIERLTGVSIADIAANQIETFN